MLNISFLACTKVELCVLTVCIAVNREKFQSRTVILTLVRRCLISKLVRVIFIYYNVFKFHVLGSIPFSVIVQKDGNTETQKHGNTQTQRL